MVLTTAAGCAPMLQEMGPLADQPQATTLENGTFSAADGIDLPVRNWLPSGQPRAVILALHGFNDYSNAFRQSGAWLADQGLAVYAYDQRGFGAAPQRGVWPGSGRLVDDLRAMAGLLKQRYQAPLYLLGESMGGAVIMVAVTQAEPPEHDGVVLVAPAVWGRETMPGPQVAALDLFVHVVPWLPLSGRGIKRHPSDNIEMLRALGRDPLVIKQTRFDAVYGLVNLMDQALEASERLNGRTLLLLGAGDDIIPKNSIEQMLRRLPEAAAAERRIAVYDQGFHMLLRDLQAETVLGDVAHWIDNPDIPLPSGADRRGAARLAALRAPDLKQ